ncbi:CHAT domain-containing protein [Nonomuraea polychroma]|uniref:CHAT domain-containing protein n=1 Tax=Nonomuraea polychroma TaxID=46176 RepID=UPI003D8CB345
MTLPRALIRVSGGTVSTPAGDRPLGELPHPNLPAREYGQALFAALLGPLWTELLDRPDVRQRRGIELALDLPVQLHQHMWEAMHDGERPLGANLGLLVAITRLVASESAPPAPVAGAPRVLFASGAELTDQVILPGSMFLGLLRECESDGLALARVADDLTTETLAQRCESFRPDLIHLVAHGTLDEDGDLLVELSGTLITPHRLVQAMLPGAHRPLAVVLSVCHTAGLSPASLAASLIEAGVPIVVAMDGEVAEPACRLFSKRMMRALLNGEAVAEAAAHGRRAALVGEPDPTDRNDWARPTVFTAAALPANFRPVDPAPARAVLHMARQLDLAQQPVYIGRRAIFEEVDALFTGRRALLAACTEGGFSRLGTTRLLREIGFRLLHAGHLPLLLAPHTEHTAPRSLRQAVGAVLKAMVTACERLGLDAPPLETVEATPPAGKPQPVVRQTMRKAIGAFLEEDAPLAPDDVRELLALDMETFAARAASALGLPFGTHTRAVVLGEALHHWRGALGWIESEPPGLLDLLTPNGLGSAASPTPVIVTAALDQCVPLRAFKSERSGMNAYRFEPLQALPDDEAALGYQWVLLHPWHPDDRYRKTWVAAPDHDRDALRLTFSKHLRGQPARVADTLYFVVELLADWNHFTAHDDEGAWRTYAEKHRITS